MDKLWITQALTASPVGVVCQGTPPISCLRIVRGQEPRGGALNKFFSACAAMLCLGLAYHFSVTDARGQSTMMSPRFVGIYSGHPIVVSNGQLWLLNRGGGWQLLPSTAPRAPDAAPNSVMYYSYPYLILTTGEGRIHIHGEWYSVGLADSVYAPVWR